MGMIRTILLGTLATAWVSTAWGDQEVRLSPEVQAIITQPMFKTAQWGMLLADRATGEVLQSLNADKLFVPASTTKLFSTATALDVLGADYRFKTSVYRKGKLDGAGVLRGDLILVASGDPTLGGRTTANGEIAYTATDHTYEASAILTEPDPLAGLNALAKEVAKSGIRRVDGEIYIDDRLFEPGESSGSGPKRVSSITVNDNVIDIIIQPTKAGEPAEVTWRPQSARIEVDAQVTTVEAKEPEKISVNVAAPGCIVVRGQARLKPEGETTPPVIRIVEVEEPASFARGLFIEALERAGVQTDASPLASNPSVEGLPTGFPDTDRVARLVSPPFSENIRLVLKVSHNLHASTLPILVGLAGNKPTAAGGLAKQREVLTRLGVDADSISFGGGAGGSPADLVTPEAAVALLRGMARHKSFAVYERGLPILGVDGTLAESIDKPSPAMGKVRAKTGTYWWQNVMNDKKVLTSKALAGYITAKSGRELVFAIFVNYVHMASPDDRQKVGKTLGKISEVWSQAY